MDRSKDNRTLLTATAVDGIDELLLRQKMEKKRADLEAQSKESLAQLVMDLYAEVHAKRRGLARVRGVLKELDKEIEALGT